MGDYAKSESFYQRALSVQERNPGPEHPDTAETRGGLAQLYMRMGDCARTEPLLQRALKIQGTSLGPEHPKTAQSLSGLAAFYFKTGEYNPFEALVRECLLPCLGARILIMVWSH